MLSSCLCKLLCRGGSRTAATSKMERFVIIVNGLRSILDVAAVLDPPLVMERLKVQLIRTSWLCKKSVIKCLENHSSYNMKVFLSNKKALVILWYLFSEIENLTLSINAA